MKSENYITIQGFMRTEFGLKGNELICYALIYGFCQDESSKYQGSQSYIAEWLGVSRSTANILINKLVDKGYLLKHDRVINNVKFVDLEIKQGVRKSNRPLFENLTDPCSKIEHHINNIDIYNTDNNAVEWKNDYNEYINQLRRAYNDALSDKEWIQKEQRYNPGLDIQLSLEKACVNYWATEAGWKKKKAKRSIKEINWKSTFSNALSMRSNQVWKNRKSV